MLALLKRNLPFAQLGGIFLFDGPFVAQEHIESFYFCQNSGTYTAFGPT